MNESFAVPLRVGQESFGLLLLLDIMDTKGIEKILEALKDISGLLSVILKNSFLYRNLETLAAQKTRALRESEERFRSLVEQAGDGFELTDAAGNFIDVNQAACRMTGYSREEMLGLRAADIWPRHEYESFVSDFQSKIGQPPITYESRRRRKDTGEILVEVTASIIEYGGSPYSLAMVRDITDRKKAEEEKKALREQLFHAQKMEAVGTLAGGVAHDFNNILQAISGYTQILLLDKTEADPEYTSLTAILTAATRAADLVRQLLFFSRRLATDRKPLDLNHEVASARRMLERTIPKMIDIEIHPGSRLWIIMGDPVQIEQILLNLGTNAADAMPDGGRLIIETENLVLDQGYADTHLGARPGRYVLMTVSDTGHGIDEVTVNHIFEPFFTTKEIGKGTGLGLASVYGIVKSHGGYITCYSQVGQGTTFKIYLPAMVSADSDETKPAQAKSLPGGKEIILLVDDEEAIRDLATRALVKFGYTVLTASSGEEALEIYRHRYQGLDLVVMDIGMPGMGGHRCFREILKINPLAKVLVASGYSIQSQLNQTLEAGAAGYVGKPFQLADLLTKVRAVLDKTV